MDMDLILELMSRASMLIYEENQLMKMVNKNADLSFINGAEEGRDIEEYNLTRKNDIDLFNKRKEIFAINNKKHKNSAKPLVDLVCLNFIA